MTRLLQSGWLIAVIGAVLYGAVTVFFLNPSKIVTRASAPSLGKSSKLRPSWEFFNPEVDRLISELKLEKEVLAAREQDLNDLAARLQAERAELNIVTQAVHQMQIEFDRHIVRVNAEEEANLRRLAKTYAAMSPEAASQILAEMEDDQVVKILVFMREKETAALMESFALKGEAETKRIAEISERLRTALFRKTSS